MGHRADQSRPFRTRENYPAPPIDRFGKIMTKSGGAGSRMCVRPVYRRIWERSGAFRFARPAMMEQ